jgi:adhesin/invasin
MTLQEVSVLIDGVAAPLYYVSPGMISALVPYRTAGTTATIVVNNNGAMSNAVEVPLAATAPGVFSRAANGIGPGVIQHTNLTPVNVASPAKRGETVLVYLSGLGAVSPAVADGTGASADSPSTVIAPVSVLIGGLPATVSSASLAPGVPGLYVVDVVVPPDLNVTAAGPLPLAVETPDSFHDMVDLIVSP